MKTINYVVLLILCCFAKGANSEAADLIPILETGKSWLVAYGRFDDPSNDNSMLDKYVYWVDGNTTIKDEECFVIKNKRVGANNESSGTMYACESDGVVYIYSNRYSRFLPIIDMNMNVDESLCNLDITEEDVVTDCNGIMRKKLIIGNPNSERQKCWVEGIGFNSEMCMAKLFKQLTPQPPGISMFVLACYQDDECIFSWENFNDIPSLLQELSSERRINNLCKYNLNGCMKPNPEIGDLYIDQLGQKIIKTK